MHDAHLPDGTYLPDKPSDLLQLALDDLQKTENDDRYVINMDVWHDPGPPDNKCRVCLAGSVMAQTLQGSPWLQLRPESFDDGKIDLQLCAIDHFREGDVTLALDILEYRFVPATLNDHMDITPYKDNPTIFREDMLELIKHLRENAL